jgi:uncharacterized iron-regulated membrane protein
LNYSAESLSFQMKIKKVIRIIHLWLGLISGLVIFIQASTGCIYAFEEEIRASIHQDLYQVQAAGKRISLENMIHAVKENHPKQKIKNIRIQGDPNRSVQINLKNNTSVFIDPYSAKVLGTINGETEFLAVILKIHRSLCMDDFGKIITGASALIFLVMIISGMILWWPGKKNKLKQKFSLTKSFGWRRLNYDLHSVLGFYASWIIIFTVLTGLVWSYKWMENGMYSLAGSVKEKPVKLKSVIPEEGKALSIDYFAEAALVNIDRYREQMIFMPEDSMGSVKVGIRYHQEGFYTKQDQFYFDQYSGKLLKEQLFENNSAGDKLKATNYNIHTGKALGFAGQLLVFFAGLISASLPITGFMYWLGKRKDRKKNK